MTEVLLSDVEDFLHIISKMINKMEFLRECYRSKHVSILEDARVQKREAETRMKSTDSFTAAITCSSVAQEVWNFFPYLRWYAIRSFPATFKKALDRRFKHATPRLYMLPHTIEKRRRLRVYGSAFDAILEVTNIASDLFFLVTQLLPLSAGEYGYLYYVSLAALTLTFTARFAIGLWDYKLVDWDDAHRSRMYVFGVLLGIVEPNSGFNDFIKESFKIQESLSYNIIGDAVGSFVKDPIATQAKADYKAAHMSIWTAIVLLIQDIPQIVVEVIFIIVFQGGEFEFVYWLALLTSLLSAFPQLIEAVFLLRDIPGLHNLILVRHLVFNPNNDIDYKIRGALEKSKEKVDSEDDDSGDDVEVEFYYGKRLVSKALTKFFEFDRRTSQNSFAHALLWGLSWLRNILLIPFTFGASLSWKSSLAASWSAYHHFRSKISSHVLSEGKPFDEGQTLLKRLSSAVSCPSAPCMGSEDGDASRLSSILVDPLFGRMDSKTLFRSIRSVELTDCISITDDILKLISCMCPNLQNLNLSFCTKITDEGLGYFEINRCIALGSVVLDGCIEVTSLGVCHIAKCSGKNLWRLSLRDLPSLNEDSLKHIAKYCTGLRFLALDVNLLVKEKRAKEPGTEPNFLSIRSTESDEPGTKASFLSFKSTKSDDKGLVTELLKRCSSLQTLKLSNVLDKEFTEWEGFAENINLYIRTLSLAGAANFSKAELKSLTKNTPFLRELRLSGVRSLESAECLESSCHSLRAIHLSETQVPMKDADTFFASFLMPDVEVVQIDHPTELFLFYTTQLEQQLEALRRNDTALAPPRSPFPLCCRAKMADSLDENISEAIEKIELLLERMHEHNVAGLLRPNHEYSTKILSHVVTLVDFVRRVSARRKLSVREYEDWEKLAGTKSELERCEKIVDRAESILDAVDETKGRKWGRVKNFTESVMPLLKELHNAPLAGTKNSPFLSLPSFDIMSTRRLNLKIDFRWNIYEFICPDVFDDVYLAEESTSTADESGRNTNISQIGQGSFGTISSQAEKSVKTFRLTGTISKIWPITVRTPDIIASRLLERYWHIPPEAKYFCWANPLTDLKASNLNWYKHQRYEDTTRRFLFYGGFLYFDANRHFVSASALTDGTTLSFNGPFKLNKRTVDKLQAENRWHVVTIQSLQPEDAEKVEFCFVFYGEKVLAPEIRRHCPHGGFAYRFTFKGGDRPKESYFYPLASAVDVFLRREDAPDKNGHGDASDDHEDASDYHGDDDFNV